MAFCSAAGCSDDERAARLRSRFLGIVLESVRGWRPGAALETTTTLLTNLGEREARNELRGSVACAGGPDPWSTPRKFQFKERSIDSQHGLSITSRSGNWNQACLGKTKAGLSIRGPDTHSKSLHPMEVGGVTHLSKISINAIFYHLSFISPHEDGCCSYSLPPKW